MVNGSIGNKHHNDKFAYLTGWYNRMVRGVSDRRKHLESGLANNSFNKEIVIAGKNAGRRPSWHLELPLLERIKNSGFSRYVMDFGALTPEQFDAQLHKGEKLMTQENIFKGDKRKLIQATLRVREKCQFPNTLFTPATVQQAADEQLNHTSSSGHDLYRRKGHVLPDLITKATNLLNGKDQHIWDWPIVRGFRIQIRESLGELSRKIRLMYPYPGSLILLEDTFIMPFVKHFIAHKTFYIIGRTGGEVGDILKLWFNKPIVKRITSLDVSAYDQNLVNEAIICAFWVLRSQLRLTILEDDAFNKMVMYFCTSLAVSRDTNGKPYAFIKHHGVPSGSGFTNMIDTIAHAIVLEYLETNIVDKCLICGDDNIFDSTNVDLDKLYKGYEYHFCLPISIEKTDNFKSWRNLKFLGFEFKNGIRYVSPLLVINQMLWHQEFITDLEPFEREVVRGSSILLNGKNGRDMFSKIFPEIMEALKHGIDIKVRYLQGYAPPTMQSSALNLPSNQTHLTISLKEHLARGYIIR